MSKEWSIDQGGVFPGANREPRFQDVPQAGTVLTITAKGVRVELDGQPGIAFGPAPWSLGTYNTAALALAAGYAPRVGDRVLVVFAGIGVQTPVVTAWWR